MHSTMASKLNIRILCFAHDPINIYRLSLWLLVSMDTRL